MTYGALVSFSYVNSVTDDFGVKSETMKLDIRPNTPKGLEKVNDVLKTRHPMLRDINILNMIPLADDPVANDDWE